MKIIKQDCYKGTRIILGNEKPNYLQKCRKLLIEKGYVEIQLPIIQLADMFTDKVGEENNNMMYNFKDRGQRSICLAPEYTAVIQNLSDTYFKNQKNVKVFYVAECFRGEKPQLGRYRQFTQLGVEIINNESFAGMPELAYKLILQAIPEKSYQWLEKNIIVNRNAKRGLDYYNNGKGFEISCNELGSSKQICGGGSYEGGIGFAVGVDRLLELNNLNKSQ